MERVFKKIRNWIPLCWVVRFKVCSLRNFQLKEIPKSCWWDFRSWRYGNNLEHYRKCLKWFFGLGVQPALLAVWIRLRERISILIGYGTVRIEGLISGKNCTSQNSKRDGEVFGRASWLRSAINEKKQETALSQKLLGSFRLYEWTQGWLSYW